MADTDFQPIAYILATHKNGSIYIGVTSNLLQRLHQHREGIFEGHSKAYGIKRLVWYEVHETMDAAITREKQLKKWNQQWKADLIERANPEWRDLAVELGFAQTLSRLND